MNGDRDSRCRRRRAHRCGGMAAARCEDQTLRIAMGSPGEAQIASGTTSPRSSRRRTRAEVEMNYQDDDMYQTIGLPNLLNGRNAPDIYFEWVGNRLLQRHADGFAPT